MAYGLDGFAHAAEALVGAALGARDRHALRSAIRVSTLWSVLARCCSRWRMPSRAPPSSVG